MKKTFYSLTLLACWFIFGIGSATRTFAINHAAVRSVSTSENSSPRPPHIVKNSPQEELETPFFNTEYPVDQNNIRIELYSSNDRGEIEIYRSRNETSGYELIGTIPYDEWLFLDPGLNVRTTYYYRWRAVDGADASPFSAPQPLTTLSINYWPTLTAELINENTIRLTFTDNSRNDDWYEIHTNGLADPDFNHNFSMLDSGRVVTFDHTGVQPGETYRYEVMMPFSLMQGIHYRGR